MSENLYMTQKVNKPKNNIHINFKWIQLNTCINRIWSILPHGKDYKRKIYSKYIYGEIKSIRFKIMQKVGYPLLLQMFNIVLKVLDITTTTKENQGYEDCKGERKWP